MHFLFQKASLLCNISLFPTVFLFFWTSILTLRSLSSRSYIPEKLAFFTQELLFFIPYAATSFLTHIKTVGHISTKCKNQKLGFLKIILHLFFFYSYLSVYIIIIISTVEAFNQYHDSTEFGFLFLKIHSSSGLLHDCCKVVEYV